MRDRRKIVSRTDGLTGGRRTRYSPRRISSNCRPVEAGYEMRSRMILEGGDDASQGSHVCVATGYERVTHRLGSITKTERTLRKGKDKSDLGQRIFCKRSFHRQART